jgi:hypothetical protein
LKEKFEMIVAFVNPKVSDVAASAALIDQFNSNEEGFALVNQSAQTAASVANVVSITAITAGFIPFVSINANVFAGTLTFLKISADLKAGKPLSPGDAFALLGNVAGIVAGGLILAGTAIGVGAVGGIAIFAGVGSIVNTAVAKSVFEKFIQPLWDKYFKDTPEATYSDHWVSPDLQLLPRARIISDHNGRIAEIVWDPATNALSLSSTEIPPDLEPPNVQPVTPVEDDNSGGDYGGGGHPIVGNDTVVWPTAGGSSEPASATSDPGSAIPGPGSPGWANTGESTLGNGQREGGADDLPKKQGGVIIEIIHENLTPHPSEVPSKPEPIPPAVPPAAVPPPVTPAPEKPKEPQDSYGCCTGSQDSYG